MSTNPVPGPVHVVEGYGLGEAPADGSVLAWPTVAGWLVASRSYWVTTVRADGRPHATPVWGLWIERALWFSTDPASVKGRNLARDAGGRRPPRERRRGLHPGGRRAPGGTGGAAGLVRRRLRRQVRHRSGRDEPGVRLLRARAERRAHLDRGRLPPHRHEVDLPRLTFSPSPTSCAPRCAGARVRLELRGRRDRHGDDDVDGRQPRESCDATSAIQPRGRRPLVTSRRASATTAMPLIASAWLSPTAVAAALDDARVWPRGSTIHCPLDVGERIPLLFQYRHGPRLVVTIDPTGCLAVQRSPGPCSRPAGSSGTSRRRFGSAPLRDRGRGRGAPISTRSTGQRTYVRIGCETCGWGRVVRNRGRATGSRTTSASSAPRWITWWVSMWIG